MPKQKNPPMPLPFKKAPLPLLRRMSVYHQILREMKERGVEITSSTGLSEAVEYKPIQIRKDLQATGIVGKPKIGFRVNDLLVAIENFIGWTKGYKAVLFGAGNLGSALLNYPWLSEYGLRFIAAFDVNPSRYNILINHIPVHPLNYFPRYIKSHSVDIGVIAVPISTAQDAANMIVSAGIKAIWNFSATHLKVPADVIVENASFTQSLVVLTRRLTEKISVQ